MFGLRLSAGWPYLIAVASAGLVLGVDALVSGSLQIFLGTVAFVFAVWVAAATGGWKPGMLATALSVAGYIYLFVAPHYSFWINNAADVIPLLGYVLVGGAISILCEGVRAARARSEERQCRLEQEIAEHKRAELALKASERRKDEFLATLAHELRNPLAPIRNGIELLRLYESGDSELKDVVGIMDRQVQHMVRLIDDLLEVSRITRGKLQLKLERVELAAAIQNAIEAADPLITAAGHELAVSLPSEPMFVMADLTRLGQVFTNLLNNAAKYTQHRGRISLTVRREGSTAIVAVRDNGIGIAPEHLGQVFEPFAQAAPALDRPQGGLGIGLSLARRLVELHDGRIEAQSAGPGTGSEFRVHLPIAEPPSARSGAEPEHDNALGQARCRVLIADDNPDTVASLAMMLRRIGCEVHTATNGAEAVAAAKEVQPDVALLDIGMPELNGYEAARRIRKQPWGNRMRMIAITGWGKDEDKRRASEAGFDHHLTKPLELKTLQELLPVGASDR